MSLYPTNLSQMKEHGSLCFTSNGTTIEKKISLIDDLFANVIWNIN